MPTAAFRLALRIEGDKWSAYCAKTDSMDDAVWMGSIALSIAEDKDRKRAFIELMKGALADFLKSQGVDIASWDEHSAPEHERAGSA